jgi:hypothetical protein
MGHANRQRVKLRGRARVVEVASAILEQRAEPSYPGRVERAILFEIEACNACCSQHIYGRIPARQVAP